MFVSFVNNSSRTLTFVSFDMFNTISTKYSALKILNDCLDKGIEAIFLTKKYYKNIFNLGYLENDTIA